MKNAKEEIVNILRGKFLVEGNEATKNWGVIFFFFFLAIIMIASSHSVDQKVYEIAKIREEINELKSEFVDVRSQLQKIKLESTLVKQLKAHGLNQPTSPPQKIKVIVKK